MFGSSRLQALITISGQLHGIHACVSAFSKSMSDNMRETNLELLKMREEINSLKWELEEVSKKIADHSIDGYSFEDRSREPFKGRSVATILSSINDQVKKTVRP